VAYSMLALVFDPSGLEWADLGVVGILLFVFGLLCWFAAPIMLHPIGWILVHTFWRLRASGRQHIPKSGGVLLISNHVSYIDWLFIWLGSPRTVRFIASASHSRNWFLRQLIKVSKSISVDDEKVGPHSLNATFQAVADALDRGEVVCIFPEAHLTRTGALLPFHRGFERILKLTKQPVTVLPVHLMHLWGSIFSYKHGRIIRKWPEQLSLRVAVLFGTPLPMTATAGEAKQAVQRTGAELAILEADLRRPVHREFVRRSARHPLRKYLIDTSTAKARVMNYGRVFAGSLCLRNWLKPRIGTEQFVGIWLPTSVGSALVNIAMAWMRRTTVNLNYTAGPDAVKSAITQSSVKTVITSKKFVHRMPLEVPDGVTVVYLEDALGEITKWQRIAAYLKVLLLPGWWLDYVTLRLGGHRIEDIATVIFSSGSTGDPKGVMLSHRNIAANISSLITAVDLGREDCIHSLLPFFHSFGYTITLWGPSQAGASALYHPDPRQAKEIGEQARTYKTTILLSTATFMRFYLRRCEPDDFKSVRILICGAERLPPALAAEFDAKFGVLPLEGYGCTELSPVAAANIPDKVVAKLKQVGNKTGTTGQAIPGVACRIVNLDTQEPIPLGSEGMLEVLGANVMVGYLGKPDMTAKVVREGWYTTGDMGRIDDDGFITLTGRLSRFAKIGGEMVPLERVEEELQSILDTNDRMLAVTSIADEKRGERLIVLHLKAMAMTPRELCDKLGERSMPNLWQPDHRDFFEVEEIPVLGTGKLDIRSVQVIAKQKAGK